MRRDVLLRIRNDKHLFKYIRENSEWYKIINRDPKKVEDMSNQMKEKYQLRPSDKLEKISTGLDLISLFFDSKE